MALRRDLDVEDDWPWRHDTLSCGQQKRLQVACALWQRPDLLVMDEPTNHVDVPTREAVTAALARFKGVGLLISHDRALLETDCPYMAPEPVRGTRNDSRNIAHVAAYIGTIWDMDAQAVLDQTAENARRCFGL